MNAKPDHAAALEWATMRVEIPLKWQNDVSNCAAAYLERDRQLEELQRIAAHVPAMIWIKAKEEAGFGTEVKAL